MYLIDYTKLSHCPVGGALEQDIVEGFIHSRKAALEQVISWEEAGNLSPLSRRGGTYVLYTSAPEAPDWRLVNA